MPLPLDPHNKALLVKFPSAKFLVLLKIVFFCLSIPTKRSRSKQSARLLTYGLTNFDTIEIFNNQNSFQDLDVWLGKKNKVKTHLKTNIYKTIQKARLRNLKVVLNYEGPLKAPIIENQKVGEVKIYYKDNLIDTLDLLASENIEEVNKFTKLIRSINFLIWGDV